MPRRLPAEADNHLISFGSAGFSAVTSNKQAWLHTYKSGLSIQYLVVFFFFCICIIICCLKVCFSRTSSTSPGLQVFQRSSFFISRDISLVLANMASQSVTNGFRDTRTTVLCPLGLLEGRNES